MASNLGTVFVELSLDDKVYKQKLSEVLTSTQTTAKGAETAWKALGIKSDAMFEAQARAAQNAYTLIKSSATSTSADIMRAEEAKNAKLTQLNEQQYGKQTSFIDDLKKNWMAASAAIIAAWMLVNKAISIGKEIASTANDIKRMSETIGISTDEWQKFSYAAKMSDVSNESLMRGMKALSASMEEFNNKSGDGYKILTALGLSTVDVTGKQKPLTQMFKEVATEFSKYEGGARMVDYANKLMGKSGMDLIPMFKDGAKGIDEYGEKLVRMGSVIGEVAIIAGSAAEDQFKNLDTRMNAMKISLAPLILLFAKGAENLAGMISWITKPVEIPWWLGGGTFSFFTGLQANPISALDKPLELAVSHGEKYVSTLKKVLPVLVDMKKATEDAEKAEKKLSEERDKAYAKEFSNLTKQLKAEDEYAEQQIKNTIEIEKAEKKLAEEREKEIDLWVKSEIEAYARIDKENEKFVEDETKRKQDEIDRWVKGEIEAYSRVDKENEEFINSEKKRGEDLQKDQTQLAANRLVAYQALYKDLAGYEQSYYESSKMIILNQEADYRKLLIDKNTSAEEAAKIEILLAQRTAEELRKLDEERILRSNDFFGGMKVAMDQNSREQVAWGQVGADVFKKFTQDAEKQFSDNLFNALTLKFDQLGIDWNSLWEGMLRTLTDKLAKMAIEAATAEIWKVLEPVAGGAWDWISSIFAAKGIWDVKGAAEGIPVIAHPGEMIIPADLAELIRQTGGGGEFAALQSAMTTGGKIPGMEAFMTGMAKEQGRLATIGGAMTISGKISPEQFMAGLFSPQALASSAIKGGIPAVVASIFGLDPSTKYGYGLASMGLTALGAPGLLGALGGILGMGLTEAIMDVLDARKNEAYKDYIEDMVGWVSGHFAIGTKGMDRALAMAEAIAGISRELGDFEVPFTDPWADYGPIGYEDYWGGDGGGGQGPSGGGEAGGIGGQGPSGGEEAGGFRRGGIARGPESGYWARLHGTEEITPLKNRGGSVKGGQGGITVNFNVDGSLIADQQTFDEFIEKIDYALNKRSQREYAS